MIILSTSAHSQQDGNFPGEASLLPIGIPTKFMVTSTSAAKGRTSDTVGDATVNEAPHHLLPLYQELMTNIQPQSLIIRMAANACLAVGLEFRPVHTPLLCGTFNKVLW